MDRPFAVVIASPSTKGRGGSVQKISESGSPSVADSYEKAVGFFSHATRRGENQCQTPSHNSSTSKLQRDLDGAYTSTREEQDPEEDHANIHTNKESLSTNKRRRSIAFESENVLESDIFVTPKGKGIQASTPRSKRASRRHSRKQHDMDSEYEPTSRRTPKNLLTPRRTKDNPVAKHKAPSFNHSRLSRNEEGQLRVQDFTKRMHRRIRNKKKYNDVSDRDSEGESDGESTLEPELYKILDTCLRSLAEWAVQRDYTPKEALDLLGLPYLFNKRWKKATADIRKPNSWNVIQSDQHRNKLVPESRRGRTEAARFLSQEWKKKEADEVAEYADFRDEFAKRNLRDPSGHQAASQRISRRMKSTVSLMETMGVHGFIYVADTAWTPGTNVWGTKLGGDFTEVLGFIGLGHHMFEDFCRGHFAWSNINKMMETARGTYLHATAGRVNVVSEVIQQSLVRAGLARIPERNETSVAGAKSSAQPVAMLSTKERLQNTFSKVSGSQHEQDHADVQQIILTLFNRHLAKPRMKCPDKPWSDFMKRRRLLVCLPDHITWDEFEGPKLKRRDPGTTLKLKRALMANAIDIVREGQPRAKKQADPNATTTDKRPPPTPTDESPSAAVCTRDAGQLTNIPSHSVTDFEPGDSSMHHDSMVNQSISTTNPLAVHRIEPTSGELVEVINTDLLNKVTKEGGTELPMDENSNLISKNISHDTMASLEKQWAQQREETSQRARLTGTIVIPDDNENSCASDDEEDGDVVY